MSALPPKADIRQRIEHVCFVPIADIVSRALLCDLTRMMMSSTKPPSVILAGMGGVARSELVTAVIKAVITDSSAWFSNRPA